MTPAAPKGTLSPMELPDRNVSISLPAFLHAWPLSHVGFPGRAVFALRHMGVVTLGELEGRTWGLLYDLHDVGRPTLESIAHRLNAAIEGRIEPPPPGPLPAAIALPRSPKALMDWLLRASRPRQMAVALRYLVERLTLEELGQDMVITRERVRQLVLVGKRKAERHLAAVPGWPSMRAAASDVLDTLPVISAEGLYAALAEELGWEEPASSEELYALCGLLALTGTSLVLRSGVQLAVCRNEKAAWSCIETLAHDAQAVIRETQHQNPARLLTLLAHDAPRLVELGLHRRSAHGKRTAARPLKDL